MYLGENIVHGFAGLDIAFAKQAQEPQDFDLEEGIGDPRYVMLRTVSRGNE